MTDPHPTSTREYLRANLFDGSEAGELTTKISTFLDDLTEVVDTMPPAPQPTDRERLAEIVSDSLAAATQGTEWAEAPEPSDEPGSPYVMRLTNEIASRLDRPAGEDA